MHSRFAFLVLFLCLGLSACGLVDATGPEDNAKIQVRLLGGSVSYDAVNIVIDSVQIHGVVDDTSEGWTTLVSTGETYDLLTLVNGVEAILTETEITPGSYSQLRLYIGEGSHVMVNGHRKNLTTPSGGSSGVKLNMHADIEAGLTYRLRLRFDPYRSIVIAGNPRNPKFNLKPVITVVPQEASSAIVGVVLPDTVAATVWAYGSLDTVSTSPGVNGQFILPYLVSGIYSVSVVSTFGTYAATLIPGIAVSGRDTVDVGSLILTEN